MILKHQNDCGALANNVINDPVKLGTSTMAGILPPFYANLLQSILEREEKKVEDLQDSRPPNMAQITQLYSKITSYTNQPKQIAHLTSQHWIN